MAVSSAAKSMEKRSPSFFSGTRTVSSPMREAACS